MQHLYQPTHKAFTVIDVPPLPFLMIGAARASLDRKNDGLAPLHVRFETCHKGLSVQIMCYGAYADSGYVLNGKHHEIYLGDPRRTAPGKLRTTLRQPVRRIE